MDTVGKPVTTPRRKPDYALASAFLHLLLLVALVHQRASWIAPIRLPGSPHGTNLLLTYSPGKAPLQTSAPSPKTQPRKAQSTTPLPAPPTQKPKDTTASPNTTTASPNTTTTSPNTISAIFTPRDGPSGRASKGGSGEPQVQAWIECVEACSEV